MANKVLTREDVEVIHERLTRGDKGVDIARDFVVSQQTVSAIRTGEYWGHVTGLRPGGPKARSHQGDLSPAQVLDIDAALREGVEVTALAARYGVAYHTIYAIRLGSSWAWLTGRPVLKPRKRKQ